MLMKGIDAIIEFLKNFTFKDWMIVILSIGMLIFYIMYRNTRHDLLYNNVIYNDSLTIYKNKVNEDYVAKNTYVQTIKDLKKTNQELYEEIKNLEDNPLVIVKTKSEFIKDTIYANADSIHHDSLYYNLHWSVNGEQQYYSLNGRTRVKFDFSDFSTLITDMRINTGITLDVIDDGQRFRVITKSDNPYINVNDINSVIIDPTQSQALKKYFNQKKFVVGPYIGVGIDKNLRVGPQLGIGLTYKLINF